MHNSIVKDIICITVIILLTGFTGINDEKKLDLYLLIGQSNMAGRATITDEINDTLPRVFLFTNDSLIPWEPAANPLNKYSSIRKKISMQKLGPGYSFARRMALESDERAIGLIVNARGGTSIREWLPGTQYYNEAISRAQSALEFGTLKGILWLQGESDTRRTNEYPAELNRLIMSLRKDLGNEYLPVVACKLAKDKPARKEFNLMMECLKDSISGFSVVETSDLSTLDSTHFDTSSQILIGERFALEIIKLLNH